MAGAGSDGTPLLMNRKREAKLKVEMIADARARVGEGPIWDPQRQVLYWTDIRTGRFFEYNPVSNVNTKVYEGEWIGGFAVNKRGGFVCATWTGVGLLKLPREWHWIHRGTLRSRRLQFNDTIADPRGRFFAGTIYDGAPGTLYRFDPSGDITVVIDGVGISNGMGFSPDQKTMYYTDSTVRTIWAFDYNIKTGGLSRKREFVKLPKTDGIPDGMTVDAEGYIWSALWYGGCVVRFDPDGKEERRIQFPVTQTSSVMFGGKDLNELYVTTAWNGTGEPAGGLEPPGYDLRAHRGGELYRVKLDIQGKLEFMADFAWPRSARRPNEQ